MMGVRKLSKSTKKQKNLSDTKEIELKTGQHSGSAAEMPKVGDLFPEIREAITITTYKPESKFWKKKTVKKYHYTQVLGAAGPQLVKEGNLREISDPYLGQTRTDFTNVLLQDPIAAPASKFSVGAVFEDGFDLRLKLASKFSAEKKRQLTPEEIEAEVVKQTEGFIAILDQLSTWKDDCEQEQLAKDLHGVSLAQGKAAGMMLPGILDLQPGKLPLICEIVPADDLGNPIINQDTRKIVAAKLEINDEDKKDNVETRDILRADEMVYYVIGIRGLRREAKYQGISPLEPILQISKSLNRAYHLDFPLALVAAYIVKQLVKVKEDSQDEALQSRVSDFMSKLFKADTWAMAMPDWYDSTEQIHSKVDFAVLDGLEDKLATAELTAIGVPKSAVGREKDLNRDIATIEAIQFVRFVRKPAEENIKRAMENQIWNPLLSHLVGKPLSEIPVRIEMVRKLPEGGDIDVIFDSISEEKNKDIDDGNLRQSESSTTEKTLTVEKPTTPDIVK